MGGRKDAEPCDLDNQAQLRENAYHQNSLLPFVVDAVYAFAHAIHNIQTAGFVDNAEDLGRLVMEWNVVNAIWASDQTERR